MDPYVLHEARWLSETGDPPELVRDGDVTSYDDPPGGPFAVIPCQSNPSPMRETLHKRPTERHRTRLM